MRRLFDTSNSTAVISIATAAAAAALTFPPAIAGEVPGHWSADGVIPAMDLKLSADAASSVTLAELWGGELALGAIGADDVDTVDFANNELDVATHGLQTGAGPVQLTTTTTLPTGLALVTDYYVIRTNAGTIQLALSLADALTNTAVAFTDVGTGTHTLTGTATAKRMTWFSMGQLGHAQDGVVALGVAQGYVVRVDHRPGVAAYFVAMVPDAGNITVTATPVFGR